MNEKFVTPRCDSYSAAAQQRSSVGCSLAPPIETRENCAPRPAPLGRRWITERMKQGPHRRNQREVKEWRAENIRRESQTGGHSDLCLNICIGLVTWSGKNWPSVKMMHIYEHIDGFNRWLPV